MRSIVPGQGGAASYTGVMGPATDDATAGPVAAAGLAWLAGLAWQMQQPALLPVALGLACCVAGGLLLVLAGWAPRARPVALVLVAALGAALLAYGSTDLRAHARLAERLDARLEGQDLVLVGTVAAMPQVGLGATRFLLEVESARQHDAPVAVPAVVALGWYDGVDDAAALAGSRPDLRAGQRWQLPVRLKQPHGVLNPHGFDTELWLWEQGVAASGSVRGGQPGRAARLLGDTARHPIERLRQALRDAIVIRVDDPRAAGVIAALVVGDQAAMARTDWELFRDSGVAHLVSISGLHVTMFAWLAGAAVGWAWRRSTRLALWLPTPWAARWGGLAAATLYALIAGWGVPAERTLWMLASAVLLRSLGLRWPLPGVLLATAVVVTLRDPWALMQASFWLSFAAVGLLLLAGADSADAPRPGWRAAAADLLRSQFVATLGLAPLSIVFFQQVSAVGLLANLVAIPLVTLVITPLAMLGALLPPLWALAAWLVQALIGVLAALVAVPGAVWTVPAAPGWAVACGLAAAALGLMPLPWRLRLLALPLALPLLAPPVPRPLPGHFELLAADVGQGSAVLVRTREHLLLYDTGPALGPGDDAGARVLVPLLRARGERSIDLLMISHADNDHAGGAAAVLRATTVRALSSSLPATHPLRAGAVAHTPCRDGQSWQWDGVHFEVLHPTPADSAEARSTNAVSCVLRVVDAQGRSALLTGDIETPDEAALVRRHGARLRSDALLVPHHGSRTSSSDALLDAVAPGVAVVQAGYRNRFGHPAPQVAARLAARGIALVRTDQCGAWMWHDGAQSCARAQHRRYWHASGAAVPADAGGPAPGAGIP